MLGVHWTLIYGVILLASCVIGLLCVMVYDEVAKGNSNH